MGVTLTDIDVENHVFYINLDKSRLIQSEEETLKSTYRVLWAVVYGEVTDKNRNNKIDLQYKVVNSEDENR